MHPKRENHRKYSFDEIMYGICVVCLCIMILECFIDVFHRGVTYEHYCCCNVDLDENRHGTNSRFTFANDRFCLYHNYTKSLTKIMYNDNADHVLSKLVRQYRMTPEQFGWYLYIKNIPTYIIPNLHCNNLLSRINIKEKTMIEKCVEITVKA